MSKILIVFIEDFFMEDLLHNFYDALYRFSIKSVVKKNQWEIEDFNLLSFLLKGVKHSIVKRIIKRYDQDMLSGPTSAQTGTGTFITSFKICCVKI